MAGDWVTWPPRPVGLVHQPVVGIHGYSVGKPTASLVPPGQCQCGEVPQVYLYVARASTLDAMRALDVTSMLHAQALVETALLAEASVSHYIRVFTFATPDPTKPLGLVTCGCILAGGGKV
jgi:hypothetical protein